VPNPPASSGFELLRPGEAIPDGKFVDQDGKARRFGAFKGSPVVMTFIYTKCPLPTFCPLMDRHFATLQKTLKADPALKDVKLVTVSFDPVTDTPPVLKKHAKSLDADLTRWTFLTGDRDDVDQFAARFGVSVSRALNDARDITHNLRTVIIGADGKLMKVYTGNDWSPEQVVADLKQACRGFGTRAGDSLAPPSAARVAADRLRRTPRAPSRPTLTRCPTTRNPAAERPCAVFAASSAKGAHIAWRQRCSAAVVLERHGYPRCSSASSRSTSWIT
jgi:cytochrome oxidase Cu insertion factor (SCO1/SenC/PrrC family)